MLIDTCNLSRGTGLFSYTDLQNGECEEMHRLEALDSLNIRRESRKIILKEEQERAVKELISGNDVFAILPTGFGKSVVYRPLHDLYLDEPKMRSAKTCVLVISPLKSLIDDQIVETELLSCTALELKRNCRIHRKGPPQFVQNGVVRPRRLLWFVAFVHLPFSFRWSLDLFVALLLFIKGTSCCVTRGNESR